MHLSRGTRLAQDSMPFNLNQAVGCWSSNAFRSYIRENPTMVCVMILWQTQRTVPIQLPIAPAAFKPPPL